MSMLDKTIGRTSVAEVSRGARKSLSPASYISIPAILWLMLWFSINTGPWVLEEEPDTLVQWLHYVRTFFPLLVVVAAVFFMGMQRERTTMPQPVRLWTSYGAVGLAACLLSPEPLQAAYWAVTYLAVPAALKTYINGKDALERAIYLNYFSWLVTTVFLLILVFFARDALFVRTDVGLTGYGIEGRMEQVEGMPMSRSSGMSRFAAVPGIISFVLLWQSRGWRRLVWAAVFISSASLIYLMQSRGALFGFFFSLSFVMLFLGGRSRRIGIFFMFLSGLLIVADFIPNETIQDITSFIMRGQDIDEFKTLTGRTRAWDKGIAVFRESPLIGWGFQADRLLTGEHVHNTYLYAMLTGGIVGATAFAAGMGLTWLLFLKIYRSGLVEELGQKTQFILSGGILAFFTVRSITEVCGSLFAVDYMIMAPVIAYIGLLDRYPGQGRTKKRIRIKIRW